MFYSRPWLLRSKNMQSSRKVQMSNKPLVFVVRLSAIGDSVIAASAVSDLIALGFTPVFVTYKESEDVSKMINGLRYWLSMSKSGELDPAKVDEILSVEDFNDVFILDLQRTARSAKAINAIKAVCTDKKLTVLRVEKRIWHRAWQILRARLSFAKPKPTISYYEVPINITRVIELNRALIEKFLKKTGFDLAIPVTKNRLLVPALDKTISLTALNYIVIFPGASGPLKQWQEGAFSRLCEKILSLTQYRIAIIGSKQDVKIAERLASLNQERVDNFCGKLSLFESISVIANAKHVVSGDSFPGHVCEAYGISATIIFGGTTPFFGFAPKGEKITLRYLQLPCSPCTRHGKGKCRRQDFWCMRGITVEDVFSDIVNS